MAFRHVAVLRFTAGATEDQIAAVENELRELPSLISQIKKYHIGRDVGGAETNHDFVIVADFANEEDWQTYVAHPSHVAVLESYIGPITSDVVRVQYRIDD